MSPVSVVGQCWGSEEAETASTIEVGELELVQERRG